jgi:hypothetical protein
MLFNVMKLIAGVKILSIYRELLIRNASLRKRLDILSKTTQ